jgi:hypothetical protein
VSLRKVVIVPAEACRPSREASTEYVGASVGVSVGGAVVGASVVGAWVVGASVGNGVGGGGGTARAKSSLVVEIDPFPDVTTKSTEVVIPADNSSLVHGELCVNGLPSIVMVAALELGAAVMVTESTVWLSSHGVPTQDSSVVTE